MLVAPLLNLQRHPHLRQLRLLLQRRHESSRAQRLRAWNRENRQLYGPLLSSDGEGAKERAARNDFAYSDADELNHSAFENRTRFFKSSPEPKKRSHSAKTRAKFVPYSTATFIKAENLGSSEKAAEMPPCLKSNLLAKAAPHFGVPSIIVRNLKMFPMLSVQKVNFADSKTGESAEAKPPPPLRLSSVDNLEFSKFPSVTRILDRTMSEESRAALEKWRQEKIAELGLEGFEKYNRAQLERGKMFHDLIGEHFLSARGVASVDRSLEGVWSSVTPLLKNIVNPKAVESYVTHPVLKYKGIVDCIAMYQDKPMLIEWKKSDRPKPTLSSTYDNPVQLAAYFGAVSHDPNYKGMNVKDALLVIAYTDGSPADSFHLAADQMRQHWATWLTRLEKFYNASENEKAQS